MQRKTNPTLEAKLARILDYQSALSAFSAVADGVSPERLAQHACAQVARVTHIKHTKVLRYRPESGDLLIVAGVGWKPGVVGAATLPIDSASPPGRSIQTAAPISVEDLSNDREYRVSPLLRDHGITSLLNAPVRVNGRIWGLLEVDSEEPRAFDEADVSFLSTYANLLGAALGRCEAEQKALRVVQEQAEADAVWNTLIRELQHRTKNNLQTIMSFVSLQRRQTDSETARLAFTRIMERVQAIAIAHDQLSMKSGLGQIDIADYLRSLCANIHPQTGPVSIAVEASPTTMPLDRAVPAG